MCGHVRDMCISPEMTSVYGCDSYESIAYRGKRGYLAFRVSTLCILVYTQSWDGSGEDEMGGVSSQVRAILEMSFNAWFPKTNGQHGLFLDAMTYLSEFLLVTANVEMIILQ